MFKTVADLARAPLDLLELAKNEAAAGRSKRSGSIELAAAMMANHVFDWHHEHHVRSAGTPEGRAFASTFPDSDVLRRIANGTKHPRNPKHPRLDRNPRLPEWEDADCWDAYHGFETLFVEVDDPSPPAHVTSKERFVKGPFLADLPRAVSVRVRPELERQAAEAAAVERSRQQQAA